MSELENKKYRVRLGDTSRELDLKLIREMDNAPAAVDKWKPLFDRCTSSKEKEKLSRAYLSKYQILDPFEVKQPRPPLSFKALKRSSYGTSFFCYTPQIICIPLLLWALNPDNPYGYYIFLRWAVCLSFMYLAYRAYEAEKQDGWIWVFGGVAALYNPIATIHLGREVWEVVNVATVALLIVPLFILRPRPNEPSS